MLVAGVAGLAAAAMSMAAGEFVSVNSQADMEQADLARERQELTDQPESSDVDGVPHRGRLPASLVHSRVRAAGRVAYA
jgi:hypothetical protein